jgi:hypothetical protein
MKTLMKENPSPEPSGSFNPSDFPKWIYEPPRTENLECHIALAVCGLLSLISALESIHQTKARYGHAEWPQTSPFNLRKKQ